jgi:hypothetical protein
MRGAKAGLLGADHEQRIHICGDKGVGEIEPAITVEPPLEINRVWAPWQLRGSI